MGMSGTSCNRPIEPEPPVGLTQELLTKRVANQMTYDFNDEISYGKNNQALL